VYIRVLLKAVSPDNLTELLHGLQEVCIFSCGCIFCFVIVLKPQITANYSQGWIKREQPGQSRALHKTEIESTDFIETLASIKSQKVSLYFWLLQEIKLSTVSARSKAWTVFAHSNTGVVGSNPTRGMNVCIYSFFVLSCVGSSLAAGWSPTQGVRLTDYMVKKLQNRGQSSSWTVAPKNYYYYYY
jgi:hypothetical protein